jgi:hypothetical protein
VAVGAVLYARRRREEPIEEERIFRRARDLAEPAMVTASIAVPPRSNADPEPEGGWRAWLTPAELLAGIESCKATGSNSVQDLAACTLSNVFIRAEWPPGPSAAVWQQEAWSTAVSAAAALEPGFATA